MSIRLSSSKKNAVVPIGAMIPALRNAKQDGFLDCDGSILKQSEYPALYNAIGRINKAITWTSVSTGSPSGMTYGAGRHVLSFGTTSVQSSTNLTNWTVGTVSFNVFNIYFLNNYFICADTSNPAKIAYSTNAINWTTVTVTGFSLASSLLGYGFQNYILSGSSGTFSRSTNLINWTNSTNGVNTGSHTQQIRTLNNELFMVGGSSSTKEISLIRSTNAINWTAVSVTGSNTLISIEYINNTYFAYGDNKIYYSTNLINWINRKIAIRKESLASFFTNTINIENTIFAIGNLGNFISISNNGIDWVSRQVGYPFSSAPQFITTDNTNIYVDSGSLLLYSTIYQYDKNTEFSLPNIPTSPEYKMVIRYK